MPRRLAGRKPPPVFLFYLGSLREQLRSSFHSNSAPRPSRCSRDTISISRRAREIAGVCPLRRDLSLEISALFVPENNNWPGTGGGVVRENLPCFSFSRSPNTPSLSVHPPFIFSTSLRAHIASFDHVHEIVDIYNTFGKFVLKVDAIEFE